MKLTVYVIFDADEKEKSGVRLVTFDEQYFEDCWNEAQNNAIPDADFVRLCGDAKADTPLDDIWAAWLAEGHTTGLRIGTYEMDLP